MTRRRTRVKSALLHFSSPWDAATIVAFLRTRVYGSESLFWLKGRPYALLTGHPPASLFTEPRGTRAGRHGHQRSDR